MKAANPLVRKLILAAFPLAFALSLPSSASGVGTPAKEKSPDELKTAAESGDPEAQFLLGRAYWHGKDVKMDRKVAVGLYRQAAEKNHSEALAALGAAYALGIGVEQKDERQAADYSRRAAEQGSAAGQMNYGMALISGKGVEKKMDEGVRWVTKSAEQGLAKAQMRLADFYVTGDFGVRRDYKEAIKWARKAADQEEPAALNLYGVMVRDGMGTQRDPAAAVPYFQRAADKSNLRAYVNLGMAYFNGDGVERDRIQGMSWWFAGETLGDGMCRETAAREISGVSPEDIAKAKELGRKLAAERASAVVRSKLDPGK